MANEVRLIDAMDTVTKISKKVTPLIAQGCHPQRVYSEVLSCIADAPTVNAVEVVHGRWVKVNDGVLISSGHHWECSVCHKWVPWEHTGWHYCPNCGADMRERKDND